MYAKDPYEAKYQYLINKRESVGIDHFNDPKAFIECSINICDAYKNINYYNPNKENKILIVFDDMIVDMIHNKNLNSIVTDLFIRERKSYISLVFITQSYFKVPKDVTKDLANIYRECTSEPYSFFVNDTTLALNNSLRFRKNLFNIYHKNHDN